MIVSKYLKRPIFYIVSALLAYLLAEVLYKLELTNYVMY